MTTDYDRISADDLSCQTGDHLLRFADLTGRAWRYEIYIIPTFDTDPNVNEITGTNDADSLYGGYGDDIIRGCDNSDWLYGRWGRDQLFGGAGFDQVSYVNSPAGVIVSLSDNFAERGGHAEGDVLVSVEMLIGSHFADRLTGNAENNVLRGLGGADILDGAGGDNEANYFGSKKGVTVSLSDLTAATDDDPTRTNPQSGGDAQGDVLINIHHIYGSDHDDVLTGDDKDNIFWARGGADRFFLNRTGTGITTVTDFDISEGDRVRVDTADGNEDTLAKLGLAVADNGAHTNITSMDGSEVYMILENIDHALITNASLTTYFDIV